MRAKEDKTMASGVRYALRLYVDGDGTGQLMCDYGGEYECPQWHHSPERRLTWPTPEAALDHLTFTVLGRWPEFRERDVRVVRVIPPTRETYEEVTRFVVRRG
jgi:hypothetical protein